MNNNNNVNERIKDKILKILYKSWRISRYHINGNNKEERAESIEAISKFIAKAKFTLKIASGELNHFVYNDKRILGVFRTLAEKGVEIEILYSSKDLDRETKGPFELEKEGLLKTYGGDRRESPHFILVDGKSIVDEAPHDITTDPGQPGEKTFYLISDSPSYGNTLERVFSQRKQRAIFQSNT